MLVLSRKVGEEIFINEGKIQIKILFSKGQTVGVGINAPENMDIDRKEIFIKKRKTLNIPLKAEVIIEN